MSLPARAAAVVRGWWSRWFGRRRRPREPVGPFPSAWQRHLEGLPCYRVLDAEGQARMRRDVQRLIAEKEWEGCGGLALTDEIKVVIAAQASLLLLHLDHDGYPGVQTILVYPSSFRTGPRTGAGGVVSEGQANLGEAWQRGPVVLAWDAAAGGAVDAEDGRNLVLHEFAHKLDLQDGLADGTPPLGDRAAMASWVRVMTAEFARLRAAAAAGRATLLDHYGATNPAEFFAVATECFFERGEAMQRRHPDLYEVMRRYYRQDPASRARR